MRVACVVWSVVVATVVLCGCGSHAAAAVVEGRATVARVIDGDTIVVHVGGRDEHVRLLGIDTPETHKPGTPVECFGPESAVHLRDLLPDGTTVRLERDTVTRDRYGRLLAYVFRDDGTFVDLAMVRDGYAGPLVIEPNVAHRGEIERAAAAAKAARTGLWGACGGFHVAGGG